MKAAEETLQEWFYEKYPITGSHFTVRQRALLRETMQAYAKEVAEAVKAELINYVEQGALISSLKDLPVKAFIN